MGQINGTPVYEFDLDSLQAEDKPWRKPGQASCIYHLFLHDDIYLMIISGQNENRQFGIVSCEHQTQFGDPETLELLCNHIESWNV